MQRILTILVTAMLLSCCNNDDDNTPTNPMDQLPPATQTGANTGGALVNGEAFLPNNQSVQPLVCHYLDQQDFSLGISKKVNDIYYKIYIYIGNTELQVGQTYQLGERIDGNSKYGEYFIQYPLPNGELHYSTTSEIIGELTITHHDYDNAILSGTFWFDVKFRESVNYTGEVDENEIYQIREGRFDMEY